MVVGNVDEAMVSAKMIGSEICKFLMLLLLQF